MWFISLGGVYIIWYSISIPQYMYNGSQNGHRWFCLDGPMHDLTSIETVCGMVRGPHTLYVRRTMTEDWTVPSFGCVIFVPTTVFDKTVRAIRAVTIFAPCARNLRAQMVHTLTPIFLWWHLHTLCCNNRLSHDLRVFILHTYYVPPKEPVSKRSLWVFFYNIYVFHVIIFTLNNEIMNNCRPSSSFSWNKVYKKLI